MTQKIISTSQKNIPLQGTSSPQGKKLMDQVSDALRTKHYSYRTEQTYKDWIKRYILFHDKRHPREMGENEIRAFIAHLTTERKVAVSTPIRPSAPCYSCIGSFSK